ncbi:MAG TPA: Ig-like domain-containing protein, partial [Haliangiales bacterium]|nr:Ig-like domain-containing protein [Haliangiales bacterium]
QVDVETSVVQAISPGGAFPLISSGGIDVLNVNHHGSESSTNMNWMNYSRPAVALIGTGAGQTSGWDLPRIDVVEHVLLAQATACITAPPALVLQTEEGSPTGSLTSFAGYSVGNVKVTTDGQLTFTVSADGHVSQGPNEVAAAGLPRTFALDDAPPDAQPPTTSITSPAGGAIVSGTITVTADAADNVGVARVELRLDGALLATDATAPYAWSWNTTGAASGAHSLTTVAYDAAGNQGSSFAVMVTVDNVDLTPPTTSITSPPGGATVAGTITVTADAADNVGVARVELWLDGALLATDTIAPYAWTWDTTGAANGAHSLATVAYDAAGNQGTSPAVTVTVNNDVTPPTAPANLQASPAKRRINLSWTAATDNVGVTGYRIWRSSTAGGPFTQIATSATTAYTNTGLPPRSTWYYFVTAADAAGNVSASSNTASATTR